MLSKNCGVTVSFTPTSFSIVIDSPVPEIVAAVIPVPEKNSEASLDKAIRHGIIDARVNDDIEKTRFSLHIQNRQTRYSGSNFGEHTREDDEEKTPWLAEVARPNIFAQYEDNIGMLTPMVADELREAESHYPMSWIDEAFKEAVTQNKRSWRYVSRILERWDREGRHHGKSGRYPKKTGRY